MITSCYHFQSQYRNSRCAVCRSMIHGTPSPAMKRGIADKTMTTALSFAPPCNYFPESRRSPCTRSRKTNETGQGLSHHTRPKATVGAPHDITLHWQLGSCRDLRSCRDPIWSCSICAGQSSQKAIECQPLAVTLEAESTMRIIQQRTFHWTLLARNNKHGKQLDQDRQQCHCM